MYFWIIKHLHLIATKVFNQVNVYVNVQWHTQRRVWMGICQPIFECLQYVYNKLESRIHDAIDSDICTKIFEDKYFWGCINICEIKKYVAPRYILVNIHTCVCQIAYIHTIWKSSKVTGYKVATFWTNDWSNFIRILCVSLKATDYCHWITCIFCVSSNHSNFILL